jgi:hypothetical protein
MHQLFAGIVEPFQNFQKNDVVRAHGNRSLLRVKKDADLQPAGELDCFYANRAENSIVGIA